MKIMFQVSKVKVKSKDKLWMELKKPMLSISWDYSPIQIYNTK